MKILGIPEINGKVGEEEENGGAAGQLQRHALKNETKPKERIKTPKKALKMNKKGLGPEFSYGSYFSGFQSKNTHSRVKILRCKK